MAMPYDAESVTQLRSMLARKQKLSAGLRERRERGSDDQPALITADREERVGL